MQAAELWQELCKRAGWSAVADSAADGAAILAEQVELDAYTLKAVVFNADELYLYIDLLPLPSGQNEAAALLRQAAACCAQIWLQRPYYLCTQDGALRAELLLHAEDDAAKAEERLGAFLDDTDFVQLNLPSQAGAAAAEFFTQPWMTGGLL